MFYMIFLCVFTNAKKNIANLIVSFTEQVPTVDDKLSAHYGIKIPIILFWNTSAITDLQENIKIYRSVLTINLQCCTVSTGDSSLIVIVVVVQVCYTLRLSKYIFKMKNSI